MKTILSTLFLVFVTTVFHAQSVTRLLACSQFDDVLRVLDTNTYNQVYTQTLTSSTIVDGITGLARKPSTGVFYTVLKSGGNRYLGSLNPITGSITVLGNLNDNFSQITFNGNNTLLGITGTGASTASTVYRINVNNANKSFLKTLPGQFGQVICYNPSNNKVYQWTGGGPYAEMRYDTTFILSSTLTPVNNSNEVLAAVYKTGSKMVSYDWDQEFKRQDTTGNNPFLSSFTTQPLKALAYITCSRSITASSSSVCAGGVVSFTMSGNTGSTYQWLKNGQPLLGATSKTLSSIGAGYYKCEITDGCGQDTLAPGKNIVILSTPTVAITGNSAICSGQTLQLTGTSGGTSQWYKNGVLISGATTNSLIVSTPGKYNMIKTNLNGCADSAAVGFVVTVGTTPTVNISASNTVICAGQSVTLTALGATTYSWSNATTGSVTAVAPNVATVYSVVGTNTAGCSGTASVSVILSTIPTPTISVTASSATICPLNSATLSASGVSSYTWNTGLSDANLVVSPSVTTTYSIVGTNSGSCKGSTQFVLTVSNCLGIATSLAEIEFLQVFPNPATNYINITATKNISVVYISDLYGKLLISKEMPLQTQSLINVSELPAAVYFIKALFEDGSSKNTKIVLNK